jgi:hypothetical protein
MTATIFSILRIPILFEVYYYHIHYLNIHYIHYLNRSTLNKIEKIERKKERVNNKTGYSVSEF